MTICVDASLVLKLYLPEPDSELAEQLWERWGAAAEDVRAPTLIDYEIASVLRLQAHRGGMSPSEAAERFADYVALPIRKEHDGSLAARGLEIATILGQPRAYDSTYLALAERLDAPLWTADRRLWNTAALRFPRVQLLGSLLQ